ncbi:MAG: Arsenite methyltransferase [Anaerolineales bacterium]|nr:Arsenite methyltransferase [Anaerolineales bacterium]
MTQPPIHNAVREHYAERIKNNASCCGDGCCGDKTENALYPVDLLATLPEGESAVSYGCGDPITLAALQPGQTVLDLGSGAGLDCFFAAKQVGKTGKVIGVDMTPEMLERARSSAKRLNIGNVEFRQGFLENLPVDSDSVDVVISNCVINLSPDKPKVFNEAFRVLKPRGKFAVSDIVTEGELPSAVRDSLAAWAGCVAGAVNAKDYIAMMQAVGFTEISVTPVYFDKTTVDASLKEMNLDVSAYPPESVYKAVYSAKITARKP